MTVSNAAGGTSNGLSSGQVRFTVTAKALASYGTLSSFGIDQFSFNTDLNPPPTNVTVTDAKGNVLTGWTVSTRQNDMGGFGRFDVTDAGGKKATPTTPIIFTLNGLGSNANIAHFLFGSTATPQGGTPLQGSQYFLAEVTGFSAHPGSHYIGVSTSNVAVAPEPATLLLGLAALVPLGVLKLRRRAGKA